MSERFSIEPSIRIYNDDDGYWWSVGFDADALGCVRVTYCDGGKGDEERECFTVPPVAARLIADAMNAIANQIDSQKDKP